MRNDALPGRKGLPEGALVIEHGVRDTAKGGRRGRDGALVQLQILSAQDRNVTRRAK
jgi:hypothetical protein